MSRVESVVKKTSTRMADGRELIYYDSADDTVRDNPDRRPLEATSTASEIRYDPLLDEWVAIASEYRAIAVLPGAQDAVTWEPAPGRVYSWGTSLVA